MSAPTVDISNLTDRQIVNWYARHPHPVVRAICMRFGQALDKHVNELVDAYKEGVLAAPASKPPTLAEQVLEEMYQKPPRLEG